MWGQDIITKQEEELIEFEKHKIILPDNHWLNEPFKLIISPGGLCAYYGAGVYHIINKLALNKNITSIRGISAGAITAVALACNLPLKQCLDSYIIFAKNKNKKSLVETILEFDNNIIAENAHILSNEKNIEIVATEITWFGLKEKIFDHYPSREYLLRCVAASCCIPVLTYAKFPYCIEIDGKYYVDGGISTKIPDEYNKHINQLVINLDKVKYPLYFIFSPSDINIHKFMIQGGLDFISFLQNSSNTKVFVFFNSPVQKTIIDKYVVLHLIWFVLDLVFIRIWR